MGTHGSRSGGAGEESGSGLTCRDNKHPIREFKHWDWRGKPQFSRAQVLQDGPFETVLGPRFVLKAQCLRCTKRFRALSARGLESLGHDGALTLLLKSGEAFS